MSGEIVLPDGEAFFLHPGELALAVTLTGHPAAGSRRLAGWLLFAGASGPDGARHRAPHRSGLVRLHRTGIL
jgi:hypothetical protein